MKKRIELNKQQLAFVSSELQQAAFVSGLGGGKSYSLRVWALREMLKNPQALHCYVSLSYRNLKDSAIPMFAQLLDQLEIHHNYLAGDYMFELKNNARTKIIMRSQDTADTMRSVEIGSLACDELAYWKARNFKTIMGRLRDKNGSRRVRAGTTPNGYNFFYDFFVKSANKNRALYRASARDNKHLPEDYIQMLMDSYDDRMAQQEVEGLFVAMGGTRYYKFSHEQHVSESAQFNSRMPIVVGMDFNVNPMTAVLMHVYEDSLEVFDEIWLENSNTEEMADEILRRHGPCTIIPDAAGNQRRSSASRTDHALLREAGHTVERVRNPHRKDRFNATNNLFHKGRVKVNPKCVRLIEDLTSCPWNQADEEPHQGHITDALGYPVWYYFPIQTRNHGTLDAGGKEAPLIL
jgi:hypothetical protein